MSNSATPTPNRLGGLGFSLSRARSSVATPPAETPASGAKRGSSSALPDQENPKAARGPDGLESRQEQLPSDHASLGQQTRSGARDKRKEAKAQGVEAQKRHFGRTASVAGCPGALVVSAISRRMHGPVPRNISLWCTGRHTCRPSSGVPDPSDLGCRSLSDVGCRI